MPENNLLLNRLQTYSGDYECHLTVDLDIDNALNLHAFEQACKTLGAKAIIIQLANGQSPTQPMLGKFMTGDSEQIAFDINTMKNSLKQDFSVVRLKVEAGINNTNIPYSDALALTLPESCYFEYHIKMRLIKNTNLTILKTALAHYHGYLSRNARSVVQQDGNEEYRFVTQRFRCGKSSAEQQLHSLQNFLDKQKIPVQKIIREFNIFDSHADLDAGWMSHDESYT